MRQMPPNIAITVVRNGLCYFLPASGSFQPFPSEMFGGNAGRFNFQAGIRKEAGLFFVSANSSGMGSVPFPSRGA